jgi:hypothetical protein
MPHHMLHTMAQRSTPVALEVSKEASAVTDKTQQGNTTTSKHEANIKLSSWWNTRQHNGQYKRMSTAAR